MPSVQRVLLALGLGTAVQRGAQLLGWLMLAHSLGEATTGVHAQGIALGNLLAMVAAAGMRNPVARALVEHPGAARDWLGATLRLRLERSAVLILAVAAVAPATAAPWFWILWSLQTLPAALDLKFLGDAVQRTRREVALDSAASLLVAGSTCAFLGLGGTDLHVLALLHIGGRSLYAIGAWRTIRALPGGDGDRPDLRRLRRACARLSPAEVLGNLCLEGDAWLVARFGGDAVAGRFAIAARIAGVAGTPTVQLTRFLFAHQLHAARRGDPRRTIRVALRACALLLLPMACGGAVTAAQLCGLFGEPFRQAGPALVLLLLAIAAQHAGWQGLLAMLARGDDRGYTRALLWQSTTQLVAMALLVPALGATGAGAAALGSQLAFAALALRPFAPALLPFDWLQAPLAIALLTGAATALCGWLLPATAAALPLQLAVGATVALAGIWRAELRRRWRRLGAGLSEASGLR